MSDSQTGSLQPIPLHERMLATFKSLERAATSTAPGSSGATAGAMPGATAAAAPATVPPTAEAAGTRAAGDAPSIELDEAVASLRLALAVRGRTNPSTLLPSTLPTEARLRVLDAVARECDTDSPDGRWLLRDVARKQVLDTVPREAVEDALRRAPDDDRVTRALRTTLDAKSTDLASLTAADVRALLAVAPSVKAKAAGAPRPEALRWHLRRKQRIEAYDRVVAAGVYGRDDDVRELVEFCTAPSMATPRVTARFLWGTGGVGKSTLLAAVLRQVLERGGPGAPVVAHLDFDRSDLDYTSPLALSIEVLSQAGLADASQDAQLQQRCDELRRQKRHSQQVKMASQESAYREASSLLHGALEWLQGEQRPLVLVLDTFEQVESGGATAFEALKSWMHQQLEVSGVATMRIVIAGRSDPAYTGAEASLPFGTEPEVVRIEELKEPFAVQFLHDGGVPQAMAIPLYRTLGGNPLVLRLVRELAHQKGGADTLAGVVEEVKEKGALRELVQGVLYDRFLKHIGDEKARRLAHPGLVLPEITVELIQDVLAPLVGMTPMNEEVATEAFDALAGASWLVRREGAALVQQSDVRRLMLRLMAADPTRADDVRRVRQAAILYHHGRTETVHRASLAYHLLMNVSTREDLRLLDRMDLSGCGQFLRRRRDELPEIAQTFVIVLDFESRPMRSGPKRRIAPDVSIPLEQAAAHLPDDLWDLWLAGEAGIGGGEGDKLARLPDPGPALRAWKARPVGPSGRPPNFVLQALADLVEWDDDAANLDAIAKEMDVSPEIMGLPVSIERLRWFATLVLMARPEQIAARDGSKLAASLAALLRVPLQRGPAQRLALDSLSPVASLVEALTERREKIVADELRKPQEVSKTNDTTGRLALVRAIYDAGPIAARHSRFVMRLDAVLTLQRDFAQRVRSHANVSMRPSRPNARGAQPAIDVLAKAQTRVLELDGQSIAEVTRLSESLAEPVEIEMPADRNGPLRGAVLLLRGQLQELHRPARQALVDSFRGAGRDVLHEYARRCNEHMTIVPLDLQPDTFARRCTDDPAGCFHTLVSFADRARVLESVLTDALAFGTPSPKLPRVLRTFGMWDRALTGGPSSDWWSGETPEERARRRKPTPPVPFTPTTRRTEPVMPQPVTTPAPAGSTPASGATPRAHMDPERLQQWLDKQKTRDPKVYAEAVEKLGKRRGPTPEGTMTPESVGAPTPASEAMTFETIVREGRPALLIQDAKITPVDPATDELSREMIERLVAAAPRLEPLVPLVGRIDVANFVQPIDFVGTGWLIDTDVVVTNRHVAELIARNQGGKWTFKAGRFGDPLRVKLDYRHELGRPAAEAVDVVRVIWIEEDPRKADIAFLEVKPRANAGANPNRIELATADANVGDHVAVVGYPARAPAHIIPDQDWMDRIYGREYDVKRIAPGLMDDPSRGWATHDCTTLGGNSGSVVIDMKSGKAVGLHFAGLYMIENYAVPASEIRRYLRERPWQGNGRGGAVVRRPEEPARIDGAKAGPQPQQPATPAAAVAGAQLSVTVPITITLSVGQVTTATVAGAAGPATPAPQDARSAARALLDEQRGGGVLAVREGFAIRAGRMTKERCLVVSAHPERIADVRGRVPATYAGLPVQVRPATVDEQLAGTSVEAEAPTAIQYDDGNRTGPGFSFNWVEEPMKALLHVGPERSWTVLSDFLGKAKKELVSSIYEFHAAHIADAIQARLPRVDAFTLVAARQTRDPSSDEIPAGDFDRSDTFAEWDDKFGDKVQRVYVPQGNNGLVASSYHIKVTVRDGDSFWLSSGNWKRSSQPLIPKESLNDPKKATQAGNREWHVVIENATLAQRFRNHIRADYDRSLELGGTAEAVGDLVMVDVPVAALEAIEFEAPAARVLEPLVIDRAVRVKPLLTPDKRGAVYSRAVLSLIRSARRSLLFQIPYIKIKETTTGFLSELVDALVERSQAIDDFRLLISSSGSDFWDSIEELQRRGLDLGAVRRLPKSHTKGMVVDGARVLVGSHNWSADGVSLNRDASLIFDDREIAGYYMQAFELDWERATEPQFDESVLAEAPMIATGATPPRGFVRMTLDEFLER